MKRLRFQLTNYYVDGKKGPLSGFLSIPFLNVEDDALVVEAGSFGFQKRHELCKIDDIGAVEAGFTLGLSHRPSTKTALATGAPGGEALQGFQPLRVAQPRPRERRAQEHGGAVVNRGAKDVDSAITTLPEPV